jgi:hypothetical protein
MQSNILFRCSKLGALMVEPKSRSETISETTKAYLTEVFVEHKYGRKKEVSSKYITKGLKVEEDSITLFSRLYKKFYKKNEERLSNEFICGTPDLYEGESIKNASIVIDIKSSYDIHTFFGQTNKKLNQMYYWQLQGYMWLTGAESSVLAYCLANTPDIMIQDEKRRLAWKMGLIDDVDQDYVNACAEIDKNCIYDDIPMSERVKSIVIYRNNEDIERLKKRILDCRTYMELTYGL